MERVRVSQRRGGWAERIRTPKCHFFAARTAIPRNITSETALPGWGERGFELANVTFGKLLK
jgi:hypothetical protein